MAKFGCRDILLIFLSCTLLKSIITAGILCELCYHDLELMMHNSGAVEIEDKAFLKDWYQTYKISYLLSHIKQDVIGFDLGIFLLWLWLCYFYFCFVSILFCFINFFEQEAFTQKQPQAKIKYLCPHW